MCRCKQVFNSHNRWMSICRTAAGEKSQVEMIRCFRCLRPLPVDLWLILLSAFFLFSPPPPPLHPPSQGYFAELDNSELSHLIPPSLENKRDVLFGNLPEIYEFHNRWVECILFTVVPYITPCLRNTDISRKHNTSLTL